MERSIDYDRRVAPWSGLGTDISGCSTVYDALWEAGLDWTVEQRPIQTMVPNQIVIPGFKANVRKHDDEVLGIVTDRYILIEVLGTIAEQERETIHRRQAEGIAAAKAKGKHLGRPKVELPERFPELYEQWKDGINCQNFFYDLYIEKEIVLCYTFGVLVHIRRGKRFCRFSSPKQRICKEGVDRRDTDG